MENMKRLSYTTLEQIGYEGYLARNGTERVLQFGEGNFLRAFVDYFIDIADEKTGWGTKVVIVQPISQGKADKINEQDGLYTVYLRGLENGEKVVNKRIVSSVSKCLNPYQEYEEFMAYAASPDIRYIVSNTTEAGIVYDEGSLLEQRPPVTFPAKLTKFLYERFLTFGGDPQKGVVILSCELIDHNGDELKRCVLKYCNQWNLGDDFEKWIKESNIFCSTMVDRIVTGYPFSEDKKLNEENGYEDLLLDTGEVFAVWVIEGPKELEEELPFKRAGLPIIVTDDCSPYKKRKVRMLNGVQTTMVLASYLSGQDIVRKCMEDKDIDGFMRRCVYEEIIPVLTEYSKDELEEYAMSLFERLSNPFIDHSLLAISLNTTSKWKARVLPTIKEYWKLYGKLPSCLMLGFAAYIKFYHGYRIEDNALINERNGQEYKIVDDPFVLKFFFENREDSWEILTKKVCGNQNFWGENLNQIPNFYEKVLEYLYLFEQEGIHRAFENLASR